MDRSAWLGVCLSTTLWSFSAHAQEAPAPAIPPSAPSAPEAYAADYVGPTRPAPDTFALSTKQKYSAKVDLQIEVPIPISEVGVDSANAGVGLAAWFGWDLGFLVPTFDLGWSWNPLTTKSASGSERSLTRFHMGLGLVAEFENRSLVVPVIGALFDLNWWHVTGNTAVACGGYYYWGCYAYNVYDFTPGFTFKAGIDVRFLRDSDRFTLGAGVLPSVTLSGGPFHAPAWFLSPYLVFTIRG